ncbi:MULTISPECIES: beta-N-acetylhexosaminidase [unclassified Rhizobium]|uniref:beta-N-acetylhexosaminidase n=1 Tax=unclassified Rhizobium TaxID=2613769 RepID=UPI001ADCFB24|nr:MULTISPECIES: beta-N-acetylhexosaminidase [unclassified Rhizobium]MBO9098710.1 beta-N-acetylhexosaminidase [Rhizobium sp. L58/93]MBO9132485.1 beta-N-acetylhexosaminidase [Rhizobium sp. B209b/85]MBO9168976.1 beta-N-acetylhexosaminidase [Rhizobium sp. L245/93]MBO9184926.1 beta-N-acetylhexosaminidase [Rhizobium sp. E27B/91]QXZ85089.1 beta-N-acetylhexosaminidase [Rhizobium sp. K1/93]
MTESKAMILGCSGLSITPEERAFYAGERPWGFILFGRNIGEPAQIADLVAALRDSVGADVPVMIDQEGGRVQRIRPPILQHYPSGQALGDIYRRDRYAGLRAAWLMSRLHAFDLLKFGINIDCLPVLDVPVEGSSNVIGNRAYGGDPVTVTEMGRAASEGLKAGGVLPVMKHMPGHGRGFADSHHELPVVSVSRAELEAHDFPPFMALRDELMAMTCHVVFTAIDPDNPATTSKIVIDEVIRDFIGFKGLLISDDTSMNALAGTIGERAANIIAGGCDIVLHCNGIMNEMKQVVRAVPVLSGEALARTRAVEAAFGHGDGADEEAIRAEFDGMLSIA